MQRQYAFFILLLSILISCKPTMSQMSSIDDKVDQLLQKMTLEEKIGQMNQYSSFYDITGPAPKDGSAKTRYDQVKSGQVGSMLNVLGTEQIRKLQQIAVEESRLGIPLIFGYDVIHGYKTLTPIPLAETASWDLEAIEMSARNAAKEAAAAGINWTFAPMVDISRDARWGRVMEGAGEDTYLGCRVAEARVRGFQGDDLNSTSSIAATAKHFAGYGFAESGKDYNTADVGLSTLYNVILPPFKAAMDAGVRTFMNSFNELNGIPATGDVFLQRDILKGEWGFDGFVVSDWGSITEMQDHGYAANGREASKLAAIAGSDMDMESSLYVEHLKDLVESGDVDETLINDAARRILKVKYELGLFDDPYKYCDASREKSIIGNDEMLAGSLEMALKSIVLLKNENGVLPLAKSGKNIAVIGQLANDKNSPLGNWRGHVDANTAISVLEGLQSHSTNTYTYEQGVKLFDGEESFIRHINVNTTDDSGIDEAVAAAKGSDVVIMVLGEHGYMSGEGRSRANINLPGFQQELLERVHSVNENIILVLMNGRPLALDWADKNINTIVEAWHLGSRSGDAIAQVLFGDYNPSGKLPVTFPKDVNQVPLYYNYKNTGRPGPIEMVFWSHYSDQSNDPLYPFGYGLSYTTFEYSNLNVAESSDGLRVSVTLSNTGKYTGEEVVQCYIRDKFASVTRPVKELKGFKKLGLEAGESQEVVINLSKADLSFYNNQGKLIFEPGEFEIMVGGNSADVLVETIEMK